MSLKGIFPEINRIFITIDNILYLWNYENPYAYIFYNYKTLILYLDLILQFLNH